MSDVAVKTADDRGDAPLVTIALPVFNAGRHLRAAVMSIVRQTFTDWELLVIDDGSLDDAVDNLLDLEDARIRVLRDGTNKGLAARLNEAITLGRGRYFARMDQDDIAYPERLARQVAMLEQNQAVDLVGVRCAAIDAEDELVGVWPWAFTHEEICARPWLGFYLAHPTWMGRMEWFRRHRYAMPGPYLCEDQELLLRTYRSSRFATIPEILFAYRVRSRIDLKKAFRTRKSVMRVQLRHFCGARQWRCCLLATTAFLLRVGQDVLNACVLRGGAAARRPRQSLAIGTDEHVRWQAVRAMLAAADK